MTTDEPVVVVNTPVSFDFGLESGSDSMVFSFNHGADDDSKIT